MKKTKKLGTRSTTTPKKPKLSLDKQRVRALSPETTAVVVGGFAPETFCRTCSCHC